MSRSDDETPPGPEPLPSPATGSALFSSKAASKSEVVKPTGIPCANLGLKSLDGSAICLGQFLVSTCLHHLVLQERLGSSQDIDESAIGLCHLEHSLSLALLLIEGRIRLFILAVI